MVWINKDTGVVLSKDGHTLFVDLVAEDEERERDLSDIKAFISYIASSPDCPATTTLRSWAEYEDLSDHAGFLTDLLDEARGRLDGFGLSGPECGAGMDADAMGVQGPAR